MHNSVPHMKTSLCANVQLNRSNFDFNLKSSLTPFIHRVLHLQVYSLNYKNTPATKSMFHVYMYLWNWFIITLKKCLILLWVCSDVQCTSQKTKMCQKHHWPIVYQLVIHFFFIFGSTVLAFVDTLLTPKAVTVKGVAWKPRCVSQVTMPHVEWLIFPLMLNSWSQG